MLKKKKYPRLDRLTKIGELFTRHNWKKDGKRYTNFCLLAGQMNDTEFALLYELTDRFHLLDMNNFIMEFLLGFYSSNDDLYRSSDHIYITPMKKVNDKGKHVKNSKSGDIVYSVMRAKRRLCEYEEKFVFCKDASEILVTFSDGDLICFIDDFVGSGKTYHDAFVSFKKYFSSLGKQLEGKDVFAITAWAMEIGYQFCQGKQLRLYCNKRFFKEISEFPNYNDIEKKEKIQLMEQMEKVYGHNISAKYSLGFGKSEALVSILEKSPNNTFPIFWKAKNGQNIFPRF